MSCRAGFVWETAQPFIRFIEDCGVTCELVTPYMLAAPFYRGSFTCLIIPTGFGNPAYSRLLPALRASSDRIRRYVENGGNLLVFGAMIDKESVYDWLPFPVTYRHEFSPRNVSCRGPGLAGDLVHDYDPSCIECDGTFPDHEGTCVGRAGQSSVVLEHRCGRGRIVVTSIHEYPSKKFLKTFCCEGILTQL